MPVITGTYSMTKSENFDAYMAELGVGFMLRKLGSTSKPVTQIKEQDGTWNITTKTTFKTTDIKFKLGETFQEETADGRKCQSVIVMQGDDTMVQTQKCSGKNHEVIRRFQGDEMIMTLKSGEVTAVRTYKKISD